LAHEDDKWHGAFEIERTPMLANLTDLLAPVSRSEFLTAFRLRQRLHIVASDPARAETLLPWEDIDALLSGHALDKDVSIMRDGVLVPRQLYTSNDGARLNVRAFHGLLPQGVSIVMNGVHYSIPQIAQLAAAVEREMRIQTHVNAYLSFSKGGAFKPHSDGHDVLVLQVHGNKHWRVWKSEVPNAIEKGDRVEVDASVPPDHEIELAPGDVLFIPRGQPHSAAVSARCSVHLTIGLRSKTGIDFLDYLRTEADKDQILRMDLPRHSSAEETDAHEAALKRQLHQLIDAASMSQFLREEDFLRLPIPQVAVAGALPKMDDVLRITLRRRVPLPDVGVDGELQPVTIGSELWRLSQPSIDVLRWLFDHDPATMRALHAGLAPIHRQDSIAAAIRELLQSGFLIVNRREA
jgi:Cupin superfamily protein